MTERQSVPLIAAFLASAGIPIYIHLPHYAAELGISLGAVGILLLALRALDFVQDPVLGRLIDRFPAHRATLAMLAFLGMGIGFLIAFAMQPALPGLAIGLAIIFTAYSLGTILFYGQGAELVGTSGEDQHLRLAGRRETGALAGVVIAALLPGLLGAYFGAAAGYAIFGALLGAASVIVWRLGQSFWRPVNRSDQPAQSFRALLQPNIRYLLLIALLNALPVAVTSTLFLFFVQDRLQLPNMSGVFLLLFFVAAGATASMWSKLASRLGARNVLLIAMSLAIVAFVGAALLPAHAAWRFALICIVSGATLGADMVILPALFATTLLKQGVATGIAFGVWSFATKLSLAIAAAVVLPVLQFAGFQPGGANTDDAIQALNTTYALIPCALKVLAIGLVARMKSS